METFSDENRRHCSATVPEKRKLQVVNRNHVAVVTQSYQAMETRGGTTP